MTSLSTYDPDSGKNWQVDLRGYDLSALDLRDRGGDLLYADFDSRTAWPPESRMPPDFDPEQVLELGKNPGLGVTSLHAQGITGRGVGIAIIDQPLLTAHQEYADQLQWYEESRPDSSMMAAMHGAAVASIAVGKTVGVAPEADLYYIGLGTDLRETWLSASYNAQAVRHILAINERLPDDRKIRVISISRGWLPDEPGYKDVTTALEEAKTAGMFVVCSSIEQMHGFEFHGLGRFPLADPDVFASYEPGVFWAQYFYAGRRFSDTLLVPMDSRTTASYTGSDKYSWSRQGGLSWAVPYLAGVYALAAQVEPEITPDRFWSLALETGRTIELEHEGQTIPFGSIINPVALIHALQ